MYYRNIISIHKPISEFYFGNYSTFKLKQCVSSLLSGIFLLTLSIHWQNNFNEAKVIAQKQHKFILPAIMLIIRAYYRYYFDQWDIQSHTIDLEVPVKITPLFSLSPFYRYYIQTAARYFAPYGMHTASSQYYTSNYALSALTSHFFGMGMRLLPPDDILKTHLTSLELRYGHYLQITDLLANVISFAFQFK